MPYAFFRARIAYIPLMVLSRVFRFSCTDEARRDMIRKDMMYETIKNFNAQFAYQPEVVGEIAAKTFDRYIVAGMGGSHLAAGILQTAYSGLNITVHSDYGLPFIREEEKDKTLVIASSYSGNTEEVIDAFQTALSRRVPLAAITTGGALLALAKKHNIGYAQMPDVGIQPRLALGFSTKALLKVLNAQEGLDEISRLNAELRPAEFEAEGKALAEKLFGKIPVIYSAKKNAAVAYNWKIKLNESAKIPAFTNAFPELNHNEMNGFDLQENTRKLSHNFHFIFLEDGEDDARILKRMKILAALYQKRGLPVETIAMKNPGGNSGGTGQFHKIFSSLALADWVSWHLAKLYGVEAEQVPMVEEFKKLIA